MQLTCSSDPTSCADSPDRLQRRRFLGVIAGTGLSALPAWAQSYPNRPIKIILPFAAGGGQDVETRRMAPKIAEVLGGSIVVENRVGAAGIVAAELVSQAAPDGYTILSGSISQVVQKILRPDAKFDPLSSFAPIIQTTTSPTVLLVSANSTLKSAKEVEAYVRTRPGALNYGSGGIGTAAHIMGSSFVNVLKLDAVHVPFRGSVEVVPALLADHVQFAFPIAGTAVPHVKGGKVRALAVSGAKRLSSLPDVPTLKEIYGEDLFVQESWAGLWAPAATPAPIISQLHQACRQALSDPSLRTSILAGGSELEVSSSPEEFVSFMKAETAKWRRLIQITGVKAD
jgi:tripartite-type tricarboxylate transporter receptor subunit TctC